MVRASKSHFLNRIFIFLLTAWISTQAFAGEAIFVSNVRKELSEYRKYPSPGFARASSIMGQLLNTINAAAAHEDQQVTIDSFNAIKEYLDTLPMDSRGIMAPVYGSMASILVRHLDREKTGRRWFTGAWKNLESVQGSKQFSASILGGSIYGLNNSGAEIFEYLANHATETHDVQENISLATQMAKRRDEQARIMEKLVGSSISHRTLSFQIEPFQETEVDFCWSQWNDLPKLSSARVEFCRGNTAIIRQGDRLEFATGMGLEEICTDTNPADFIFLAQTQPLNHMSLLSMKTGSQTHAFTAVNNPVLPRILPPAWIEGRVMVGMPLSEYSWDQFESLNSLLSDNITKEEMIIIGARKLVCMPDPQSSDSPQSLAWFVSDGETAYRITQLTPGADFIFRYLRHRNFPFVGTVTFTSLEDDPELRKIDHPGIGHITGELKVNWFRVANSSVQGTPMEISGINDLENTLWNAENTGKIKSLPPGPWVNGSDEEISAVFGQIMNATDFLASNSWSEKCGWQSRPTLLKKPELHLPRDTEPGTVIIKFLVGRQGEIMGPRVIYSTNDHLVSEAFNMLQKCQFEAVCSGTDKPRESWSSMRFDFR
jgi:hypothetical protein